jgi:hypothetical protein
MEMLFSNQNLLCLDISFQRNCRYMSFFAGKHLFRPFLKENKFKFKTAKENWSFLLPIATKFKFKSAPQF